MFLVPSCAILFWITFRSCSVTEPDADRLCAFSHWIFASFKLQWTFQAENLVLYEEFFLNIKTFLHFTTATILSKTCNLLRKISLPLYNGHSFRRLAGTAGIKFPNRKCLSIYNGHNFMDWGVSPKILFNLQITTFSPRKTGVCLKKVKIKMLLALEKAEHRVLRI